MTAPISTTQADSLTALRSFILALISCEVIQGLGNGVPTPLGGFICMTPGAKTRLSTNVETWADPHTLTTQSTQLAVQIDCYGPDSAEWAQILSTMMRSPMGAASGILYADDPRQLPIVDAEAQYEQRWMIGCNMQVHPVVTTDQQYFDQVAFTIHPV
jgi:hypothetical protein